MPELLLYLFNSKSRCVCLCGFLKKKGFKKCDTSNKNMIQIQISCAKLESNSYSNSLVQNSFGIQSTIMHYTVIDCGTIVSGDDEGTVWMYNLNKLLAKAKKDVDVEDIKKNLEIIEPKVSC